jgi:hypothetical protein
LILVPIGILFSLNKSDLINGTLFVRMIGFYALIYRTYTDGKKLADKIVLQKKDIWKFKIPGKRLKYFENLK